MSVKIEVLNSEDKTVPGATVFVKWTDGSHSNRTTNVNGVADLGCSAGTAEYVQVDRKKVQGRIYLRNGVNTVYKR